MSEGKRRSVFAVDPGGTTGWAFVASGERLVFESGQLVGDEITQTRELVRLIRECKADDVVIEDFVLRQGIARSGAGSRRVTLSPVRITAMLEYALGLSLPKQSAADAKTFATDARLRTWGTYVRGDHARDAMRHAMLRLARTKRS